MLSDSSYLRMASPQRKQLSLHSLCFGAVRTLTPLRWHICTYRGGQSGGALFPVLVGVAADFKGAQVVHPFVLALLVAQILLWFSVWWSSRAGSRDEVEGQLALSRVATEQTSPKQAAASQLHTVEVKV